MDDRTMYIMILSAGGVVFLLIILAICWDKVEPTEYGLIYSSLSKKVSSSHPYEGGRYFLFPTNSFVTFPKTVVTIGFTEGATQGVLHLTDCRRSSKPGQRRDSRWIST